MTVTARGPVPVPILLWHAVGPDDGDPFRISVDDLHRQLDAVVESGRVALSATGFGHLLERGETVPPDRVLLTLDDGFADLEDVVVPALAARGLRATAFVTSGFVGRPGMLSKAGLAAVGGADVADILEIGAHSVSHPHLDVLRPARARQEIAGSGRALEDLLGRPVTSFAYPHGSHSRTTRELTKQAGYVTAHAVKNALSHEADDRFAVARYTVTRETPLARVRQVLAGEGVPLGWHGERWQTWGYRHVRRARHVLEGISR